MYIQLRAHHTILKNRYRYLLRNTGRHIEAEVVNATRELSHTISEQREKIHRHLVETTQLKGAKSEALRAEKRAIDEAARLQTTVHDYEHAFVVMARLHLAGKPADTYNVIPSKFQLVAREEQEPREQIPGSMDDVGLENEEEEP